MNTVYPLISIKKTILTAAFSLMSFSLFLYGQKKQKDPDCIPEKLSSRLKLRESQPLKYQVITDYTSQDIFGNFFTKTRVNGFYTRGLAHGKVQWNNVRIADASKKDDPFPEGVRQDYMENLQYDPMTAMTDTSLFKVFPAGNMYGKTLIWDISTFESFAWLHFDSLQLNIPFHARIYDTDISLAGSGNFMNHDVKLTWTGISKMNGKKCALIQFEAMENLLTIKAGSMTAKGRSHYWGNIWVSLEDKQLEGAWMNEDVMLEINFPGSAKQYINTIRRLTVEKHKDQ
jgi:hypothetical protein